MVPRKFSETFHSISKSRNGICDESRSLVFMIFLESRIFLTFCSKVSNCYERSQRVWDIKFYRSPPRGEGGGEGTPL